MTENSVLAPVGSRPRCLNCRKELRPNFRWNPKPFLLTVAQTAEWKKNNPRQFLGSYGAYGDDRFCNLTCGYQFAVKTTRKR